MSQAQRHQNFSRAGGRSSAKSAALPGSSKYGGRTRLEDRAARMNQRMREIYGGVFANIVRRSPRGLPKGTKLRRRTRSTTARTQGEKNLQPVIFDGDAYRNLAAEAPNGPVVFRG